MVIKKLAKSIRQYKRGSVLSPVFMILEVIMEVLIPFLMADLIDIGITGNGSMDYIIKSGAVLVIFAALSLTFGTFSGIFAANASTGLGANLRYDIFSHIQTFSFSNIDKFSSANLITVMTTDVNNIVMAYQAIIRQAVRSVVMTSFALITAFKINAQVSLVFLVSMPILGFGLFYIIFNVHPLFVFALKTYDRLNNLVQENLRGIRAVKSYVREESEKDKFGKISQEIYDYFTKAQKKVSYNAPLIQFCTYISIIFISLIGAHLIAAESMTTGSLMSMLAYIMLILMNLMMLSIVFIMIIISRPSAIRITDVLNEESSLHDPSNPVFAVKDGSISFRNVDFSYSGDMNKLCLSGLNFEIASGETIGIIGGTGSSKTSLIQLIPRLYDVIQGEVLVGGINVKAYDLTSLRKNISVVLQQNTLFAGSIKENILWGNPSASDEDIIYACKLAQADTFIRSFPDGYDTYIEQGGTNVSGGQRQRLCIARALIKKPKILILDDSTGAVDTKTDNLIRKAFREKIPGTTKLIIAPRITSIMTADRIIVMDNGMINGIGTHEELLQKNTIYREVYQTQGGGDFDAEE